MQILVGGDKEKKIANKKQESKFHVKSGTSAAKLIYPKQRTNIITVETQKNHIRKTV
jgi:hypothetical protein